MKKISKATMTAINRLTADTLESHGVLIRARKSGYICPLCGNGDGKDGTGIKPYVTDSHVGWKCFKCGESFNNLRILSEHYGLDRQTEFNSLVEKICAEFDVPLEYVDFDNPKRTHRRRKKSDAEPTDPKELELIHKDLQHDKTRVGFVVNHLEGKVWRGFDANFLLKHGCRVISGWTSPKIRVKGEYSTPTLRMLIPCSQDGYLARLMDSVRAYTDKHGNNYVEGEEKVHAGKKSLFNADALDTNEPVFCLEGYIDAMSCELAGFKAVALGGADRGDLLIDTVVGMSKKPHVVIMLDSDNTGRKAAQELYAALTAVGCPCCVRFLTDVESKLDCNQILVENGVDNLRGRLQEIIDDSLGELAAVAEELAAKKQKRLTDDDLNFLFEGDETDSDFANRFEKVFGDRVRWLTDDERWLTYGNGLWQRGSEKNSCLLPFVRETKDLMLDYAENKDERELAERLKSSRKILSSITMMKSLDSILITTKDLDNHDNLLNVRNGVIDLQSGKFYETVDSSLLITQRADAAFRKGYRNPVVDKFLADILPDEPTREALIRFLGYTATGLCCEEKALFFNGDGGNGKGTLTRTLLKMYGTYAVTLRTSAVLFSGREQDAGAATTELNPLEKCRVAFIEELPQGGKLDAAKFKNLSGSDFIPIRKLHHEQINIEPHFALILSGNYLPEISDTRDNGLLRRLMNISFEQSFIGDRRDPTLKAQLATDDALSGLLSLIVDAAQMWYRDGLLESAAMKQARQNYLNTNDFIGEFVDEFCTRGADLSIPRHEFLAKLKATYAGDCMKLFGNRDRALTDAIKRMEGVSYRRDKHGNNFYGVGWKPADKNRDYDDFGGEPIDPRDTPF